MTLFDTEYLQTSALNESTFFLVFSLCAADKTKKKFNSEKRN